MPVTVLRNTLFGHLLFYGTLIHEDGIWVGLCRRLEHGKGGDLGSDKGQGMIFFSASFDFSLFICSCDPRMDHGALFNNLLMQLNTPTFHTIQIFIFSETCHKYIVIFILF